MQEPADEFAVVRFRASAAAADRLHTYVAYRQLEDRHVTLGSALDELIMLLPDPEGLRGPDPQVALLEALDRAIARLEQVRCGRRAALKLRRRRYATNGATAYKEASDSEGTLSID